MISGHTESKPKNWNARKVLWWGSEESTYCLLKIRWWIVAVDAWIRVRSHGSNRWKRRFQTQEAILGFWGFERAYWEAHGPKTRENRNLSHSTILAENPRYQISMTILRRKILDTDYDDGCKYIIKFKSGKYKYIGRMIWKNNAQLRHIVTQVYIYIIFLFYN